MIPEKKEGAVGDGQEEYGVSDLVRAQRGEIVFIHLPDHLPMPQTVVKKEGEASAGNTTPEMCSLSRLQVLKIL